RTSRHHQRRSFLPLSPVIPVSSGRQPLVPHLLLPLATLLHPLCPIAARSLPTGHLTLPSSTSTQRPCSLCFAAMQPLPVATQPRPTLPCCHCFPTARLKAATSRSTRCHHRLCSSLAAPIAGHASHPRSHQRA
ncbi:hypothetical protein GW17_00059644, partial [Ensete ventricosum]